MLSFDLWSINFPKHERCNEFVFLNRHQTILHTFSQLFLNLTLSGVPHLYRQLPNGQYLSDLYTMCNLEANLWKMWTGDHRILTYIFKWERLNTAGHSHTVSIDHWVAPLYNDKLTTVCSTKSLYVLRQAKIFRPPITLWEGICVNYRFWVSIFHIVYMYQLWVSGEMQFYITSFWLYLI